MVRKKRDIIFALPMYTYSGNGLTGKPGGFPRVHLRIRDLRRQANTLEGQRRILAAENVTDDNLIAKCFGSTRDNHLHPNSHCRFHHPVTFNIKNKPIKVMGQLIDFSARNPFVRHYQHAAEQLQAPEPRPAPNNVKDGGDDDGDGNDNDNDKGNGPGDGPAPSGPNVQRTDPRRGGPAASGPQTRSRLLQNSSGSGPTLADSHTATADERSFSQTGPQTSPGLDISKLTLPSPSKRKHGEQADDHFGGGSSKLQNRSSGTRDLMELDDAGRPRRQSRIKSGSTAEPGALNQFDYTVSPLQHSVCFLSAQIESKQQ